MTQREPRRNNGDTLYPVPPEAKKCPLCGFAIEEYDDPTQLIFLPHGQSRRCMRDCAPELQHLPPFPMTWERKRAGIAAPIEVDEIIHPIIRALLCKGLSKWNLAASNLLGLAPATLHRSRERMPEYNGRAKGRPNPTPPQAVSEIMTITYDLPGNQELVCTFHLVATAIRQRGTTP